MKTKKFDKKRLIALSLSLMFVMQQSLAYQVLAASVIQNGNMGVVNPDANGVYNLHPESYNGQTGYRVFNKFELGQGDMANFIFQWLDAKANSYGNATDINTFVNFVNNQVRIDGIVNALSSMGGKVNSAGNLMFISPNGMVVGSTGVINVGNLSVLAPTQTSYENLKNGLPLEATELNANHSLAVETTARDLSVLQYGNATPVPITINGRVVARGNVELKGDTIAIGSNAGIYAGVSSEEINNLNYLKDNIKDNIQTIFDALVNTDNMVVGNGLANNKGNIVITSNAGTSVAAGAQVRNYASNANLSGITITNTGAGGVVINGEVSNSNGKLTVTNQNGQLLVDTQGIVKNNGTMTFNNEISGTRLALNGTVANNGTLDVINSSGTQLLVSGNVSNDTGAATFTNKKGQLLVDTNGVINSNGSSLLVDNIGAGGLNIKGHANNTNKLASVTFRSTGSNMSIGDENVNNNINSNAKVNIEVTNADLLNNGVKNTLINTTENAGLEINVTNGNIGKEVGPCADGVCTGIGNNARDLTKSVNTSIDGSIKAISTKGDRNTSLVNMASLNKNMNIDHIKADGRVILLADDSANKGATAYDLLNKSSDGVTANVEGTGISLIASGNIGGNGKKEALTFKQTGVSPIFTGDDARVDHKLDVINKPAQGVDMLAIKNINVKGLDDGNNKLNTNVCAMISREGNINAEFSGDTYIGETTAANTIDITTRGKNLYIDHLGEVPTYEQDYYGPNANVVPNKVKLTALDLGSYWTEAENPEYRHAADSTIVVKSGKINGKGIGRENPDGTTNHDQDLELVADNAYAGGYYFNMGKHRNGGKSTVVKDPYTDPIKDSDGNDISIRAKAVRPEDVEAIDENPEDRNYYYGGSSQGDDPHYDGVDKTGGNNDGEQGGENDDDNLVVPEPDEPDNSDTDNDIDTDIDTDTDTDIDTDTDTDIDNDTDTDLDTDIDSDTDTDVDTDNDNDTDTDIDTDTDNDTDNDTDTDIDDEPDNSDTDSDTDTDIDTDTDTDIDNDTDTDIDTDIDTDTDTDVDTDNDNDTDTDIDTDTDNDTDNDTDIDIDIDTDTDDDPEPGDTDDDTDTDDDVPVIPPRPVEPQPDPEEIDAFISMYKQRVVTDRVDSIDKRQYMRFNANDAEVPMLFESSNDVVAVTDISRGGVSLKHNKKLKVGDIVPVKLKYGDLEINANAKIVSASDVKAGAQFIDLDQATANKLLYLSMLQKDEPIAQTIMNMAATSIDD